MATFNHKKGSKGSFKLPYSSGMPSYLVPKIFSTQKTEEYFVTSLYAQHLLRSQVPVIGVEVSEDDSNKKEDSIVKLEDGTIKKIQVTRFTLTEYLKRRKVAESKVSKIIKEINKIEKIQIPVNVTFSPHRNKPLLPNTYKIYRAVARLIVETVRKKSNQLNSPGVYINEIVSDEKLKEYFPIITLQRIPEGSCSNYFGRDNVFIDLEFDNISFTQKDIDEESFNIFQKKNNGKAEVLLIWADTFEILYDIEPIGKSLEEKFKDSSFEEVYLLKFYNRTGGYYDGVEIAKLKDNSYDY